MGIAERTAWGLYQGVMAAGLAAAAPVLLALRGRHYLETLPGRLGFHQATPSKEPGTVWIHAVSVGEVGVAATLARSLPGSRSMLVTTVTPTGQAQARRQLTGEDRRVTYLPFDLGFAVERFFRRFDPALLILVEGDYWPLVLRAARRRGIPVVVVNGRVGDRSARRLARFARLGKRLFFDAVSLFAVQTSADRERLLAAGAPADRIRVSGNLKFDTPTPVVKPILERAIATLADGRPIFVAGSTMAGEDEPVLEAFEQTGGGDKALLVLVPRHPERWDDVARLVVRKGFSLLRRSELALDEGSDAEAAGAGDTNTRPDVVLLDSLGELAGLYRLARGAFIGGTLVPTGGHNPLEPACFGVPVVVGPSMDNFRDMASRFDDAEAWHRVPDPPALAAVWRQWLEEPGKARELGRRGQALLEENRGAVERTIELLLPLLPLEPPSLQTETGTEIERVAEADEG